MGFEKLSGRIALGKVEKSMGPREICQKETRVRMLDLRDHHLVVASSFISSASSVSSFFW